MSLNDAVVRNRYKQLIREALKKDKRFEKYDYGKFEEIVDEIELGFNDAAVQQAQREHVSPINWSNNDFRCIYSSIAFKVLQNLDPKSPVKSKYLLTSLYKKKIKPFDLAFSKSDDLCPEKSEKIIAEMNRRLDEKVEHKTTTRYKCPNCKKSRAQHEYVQLRSFDEGYNSSLTCIECGHKWVL